MGEGLRIETSYDHEGCHARMYDDDTLVSSTYEYAKKHDSWVRCGEAAIAELKSRSATFLRIGLPPSGDVFEITRRDLIAAAVSDDD